MTYRWALRATRDAPGHRDHQFGVRAGIVSPDFRPGTQPTFGVGLNAGVLNAGVVNAGVVNAGVVNAGVVAEPSSRC
ncbi:MAG TPA: hypothetical protein VHN80_10140 [Kineosporiaceae bacterium]|nr:hypothetical protein [Kineosporiaceae bacterium]